jgi:hypothetical protein
MKIPNSIPELKKGCAAIFAGALNGDVKLEEGRLALNAATRIIEATQAEIRARALAFATKQVFNDAMPLDGPLMRSPEVLDEAARRVGNEPK